jgi:predicted RNase H-like HicB family nuclease
MPKYSIVLIQEGDDRYSVSIPALSSCHTGGDSVDCAIQIAHEAIDLYLEKLRAHHVSPPSDGRRGHNDYRSRVSAGVRPAEPPMLIARQRCPSPLGM